jgi:hypothetical protein
VTTRPDWANGHFAFTWPGGRERVPTVFRIDAEEDCARAQPFTTERLEVFRDTMPPYAWCWAPKEVK